MLTFECGLQQLLGLCIKRLDFILLSARLPHDQPAPAALYWGGISESTWWEERQSGRLQMWSVGLGFPDCRPWVALASAWDRYSWAVLGIWWLAECSPRLASGGAWAPAQHLRLSLGTPVASGVT